MSLNETNVEIEFTKTCVVLKMQIETPIGLETIVKKYEYESLRKMNWNIEVKEIIPLKEGNILKGIRLKGALKGVYPTESNNTVSYTHLTLPTKA